MTPYTYPSIRDHLARILADHATYEELLPEPVPRSLLGWLLLPGSREDRRISRWTWSVAEAHMKIELTRATVYYRVRHHAGGEAVGAWCRVIEHERDLARLECFISTHLPASARS